MTHVAPLLQQLGLLVLAAIRKIASCNRLSPDSFLDDLESAVSAESRDRPAFLLWRTLHKQ